MNTSQRIATTLIGLTLFLSPLRLYGQETAIINDADLQAAKNSFISELLQNFTPFDVIRVVYDPRLTLDYSVVRKGATGSGFDYFSEEFGLITPATLKDGLKYRADNWKYFKKTYQIYGTESYYILGILRLETYFGQYKAPRSLPNSLYSVYVLDPARRNFALREFKNFLFMTQANGADPFTVKGSTAGAFGIPQFIPSSYHAFAVDGNGDRRVDLFNNADAIVSVGNYLKKNGWGGTEAAKRKAVYAYNHDEGYVNAVMAFGDAIREKVEGPAPKTQ